MVRARGGGGAVAAGCSTTRGTVLCDVVRFVRVLCVLCVRVVCMCVNVCVCVCVCVRARVCALVAAGALTLRDAARLVVGTVS